MEIPDSVEGLKQKGNDFFKIGLFDEARDIYTDAILKAEEENSEIDEKLKSILYGNRAACFASLEQPELCISDCDKSLSYDPHYTKVRIRKFVALRNIKKYNDALEEIRKAIDDDPSIEKTYAKEYSEVQKEAAEETERLKKEALGQLKDLGNKFLGIFGLSTDNFQMTPNGEGGYSMQFKK